MSSLASGLAAAERSSISGKDVTPFLLDHFHRETGGASLEANVRLGGPQRRARRPNRERALSRQ